MQTWQIKEAGKLVNNSHAISWYKNIAAVHDCAVFAPVNSNLFFKLTNKFKNLNLFFQNNGVPGDNFGEQEATSSSTDQNDASTGEGVNAQTSTNSSDTQTPQSRNPADPNGGTECMGCVLVHMLHMQTRDKTVPLQISSCCIKKVSSCNFTLVPHLWAISE